MQQECAATSVYKLFPYMQGHLNLGFTVTSFVPIFPDATPYTAEDAIARADGKPGIGKTVGGQSWVSIYISLHSLAISFFIFDNCSFLPLFAIHSVDERMAEI